MLSISTKENNLILNNNIKISVTLTNPVLNKNKKSNSLNFSIPAYNMRYLKAPHLTSIKRVNNYDVKIKFGTYIKNAVMQLTSASKKEYHCSINFDETNFITKYGDKNIRDLELGGERDYSLYITSHQNFYKSSDESDFVICRVQNSEFMTGTSEEDNYKNNNGYQNNYNLSEQNFYLSPRTPFIFLCYLYEQILKECGYIVKYNHLREDVNFKRIVLYSNQSDFNNSHIFKLNNYLPSISIREFITELSNILNIHLIIDDFRKTAKIISFNNMFSNSEYIDLTQYANDDLNKKIQKYTDKIIFKLGVESADLNQQPHKWIIDKKDIVILTPVPTFNDLPAANIGDISLVQDEQYYYQKKTTGWEKYSKNIQAITLGEGNIVETIQSNVSTIQEPNAKQQDCSGEICMQGNSEYRDEKKKVPFMLAFFQKKYVNNDEIGYLSYKSEFTEGTPSMYLNQSSIFNYCFSKSSYKKITSFDQIENTIRIPLDILINLDFSKLFKIKSTFYILEEFNFNFEYDKIVYGKSKLRII
jgi:hypothetical protein